MEDAQSELYQELARSVNTRSLTSLLSSGTASDAMSNTVTDYDFDFSRDVFWRPQPVHPDPSIDAPVEDPDIIGSLVAMYGNKELFITEYRNILADHLLKSVDFQTDRDVLHFHVCDPSSVLMMCACYAAPSFGASQNQIRRVHFATV